MNLLLIADESLLSVVSLDLSALAAATTIASEQDLWTDASTTPDMVLIMLSNARVDSVVRTVRSRWPTAGMLVAIEQDDPALEERLLEAGVDDFLSLADCSTKMLNCLMRHVSERRRHDAQLARLSREDALTGLANRVALREGLMALLARGERENRRVGILHIDLDRFRKINENCSQAAGDAVLIEFARRLRQLVRAEDLLARVGTDEFVVVLDGFVPGYTPQEVAGRLRAQTARSIVFEDEEFLLYASVGIASFPETVADADTLLRDAMLASAAAKTAGGNRYITFTKAMLESARDNDLMRGEFMRALQREEFQVYYQPIVELHSYKVVAMEALLRWNHPRRGLLKPGAFLNYLEEDGLIGRLGEWLIGHVVADAAEWRHLELPDLLMTFNVSSRELRRPGLLPFITGLLESSTFDPTRLIIEVTEAVMTDQRGPARDLLASLRTLGMGVAVDDIGAGAVSLRNLQRIPANFLKFDVYLVQNLLHDPSDAALASAVMSWASGRQRVIAEGVEDKAQLVFLQRLGVQWGQGHLFAAPMSFATLVEWAKASPGRPLILKPQS